MSRWIVNGARFVAHLALPIALSCVNVLSSPVLAQPSSSSLPPELKQSIEDHIETYIRSRPEIIEQALQTLAAKKQEKETARVKQAIARRQGELQHDAASPVSGDSAGNVTFLGSTTRGAA